jgi:peptidyl-prolyl cis-trans isomerase SurA
MTWQRIIGPALLASVLSGCESSAPTLARNQFLQDPELMTAIGRNGGQGTEVTRGQKPDARPPSSLLDVQPERPADAGNSQLAVSIVAIVNNQAILDEEVRASAYGDLLRANYLAEPERSQRKKEVFTAALNRIIEREIVLIDAFKRLEQNGGGTRFVNKLKETAKDQFDKQVVNGVKNANHLKTDEEVKRYFAELGVALSSVRRQWERNFMEFEYLRNRIFPLLETRVNHQMIAEYYDKHTEEFQIADSVKWQDLFVAASRHASREEARSHAEALAEQARQGADFVKLVKQNDDGDSTLRDGEGVGNKRGEIKPAEAEAVLFKLTDGQVGALIEIPTGFHVVKLVHREVAGQRPFDGTVQKQIRDKLRGEVYEVEKKKIISELKQLAVVEYARKAN